MDAIGKFARLNNQNWQTWKFRMEMMLTREELWYVIEKAKPEPASEQWAKDDKKARATMGLCIEENQYSLVKTAGSAREFWDALQRYHEKTTVTSKVSLLKKLCNLNLREGGDLESHLFEVDDVFQRLEDAGQNLGDPLKIAMILRSLPDSYSGLVTALESRPEADLTTELVRSKLLDEYERRKERSGGSSEAKAMKSNVRSFSKAQKGACFFCKQKGHKRADCPRLKEQEKQEAADKKQKKDAPKAKKATTEGKSSSADCSSAFLFKVSSGNERSSWIIDSGASSHMTNDKQFFTSIDEETAPDVVLADGTAVKSAGCGRGTVTGVDGCGSTVELTFENVLYVPSLNSGLLSVPKLVSRGFVVAFKENGCDICLGSGKVIAKGNRSGNLFELIVVESANKCESKHHNELCQHQWHRRFGHRDPAVVSKMDREQLGIGMRVKDCGIRMTCEPCVEGKLSRTPIPKVAERKSRQVLDLVHTDLCGPMRTSTPSGRKYLMTLIDDYSRYTVVFLLERKSEAAAMIMEYVRYVENLFGRKPRVIRSDGGGEYASKELEGFFRKEGIKAQYTTAYTPQQNGVAERRNRYILEMARSMLLDAKLETKYWGEAVLTAAYLQNRLSSRSVDTTPYEKWHDRKPNLDHLRVYGCKAWVHVPDVKRGKLDSKARKLTFIGYSEQHKGYRFVDLATEKVTISRDAKFLELSDSLSEETAPEGSEDSGIELTLTQPQGEQHPQQQEQPQQQQQQLVQPQQQQVQPQQPPMEPEVSDEDHSESASECEEFFDMSTNAVDDPLAIVKNELLEDESLGDHPVSEEADSDEKFEEESSVGNRSARKGRGKLPGRFSDYVVGVATQLTKEPMTYDEAVKCPESGSWRKAMDEEFQSQQDNGTWELTELPPGKKVVGSRWVFKAKQNEAGEVVRFKARIVAQGYSQRHGVDFDEVFAPVTKHATLRTLLALAGKHKLLLRHLDVKTAYLYGDIDDEIYMRQPPGYKVRGQEEKVCRLRRSIYGLKQSARCWNRKLSDVLKQMGFRATEADPCLFLATRNGRKIYLLVYVDDLLVGCAVEEEITHVYKQLQRHFEINWLGEAKFFLGLEIQRGDDGLYTLSVKANIEKLISTLGMQDAKVARTPMDQGYLKDTTGSTVMKDSTSYRSLVGSLMYIAVCARPDIATSASILGRKFSAPTEADWTAAKRVVRYLKLTKDLKLKLGDGKSGGLEAYSDSDWAGDPATRKSTSGFVLLYAGGAVSWASRRQDCVSLSSMEAEYVALGETCQEVLWLRRLLNEMGEKQAAATTVNEDNQGCLSFVKSERTSKRSKHIETKQCFIKDLCDRNVVRLQYCPTDRMKADIMTKPLGAVKHRRFAELIGLGGGDARSAEEE